MKDFFWYGRGGFVMEIPMSWRPLLKKLLQEVTSPIGAFVMGFIVCLFELPCTGGPYVFVLGLLAERTTRMQAIPLLLLYNIFFILPLIIITLLVYLGFTSVEKTTKWKDRHIRILHLIAGIVMLALGLFVTFGLV
jgi:cytochrome c biogenesis protein CcdA